MPQASQNGSLEILIKAAAAGDKPAFGRLYELYASEIFRYLYFRADGKTEAEDLTEMVFIKAWEKLPSFGKGKRGLNFRAWLYRIAHNLAIDHQRGKREVSPLEEMREIQSYSLGVEELAENREEVRELRVALGKLEPIHRQIVELRFIAGLDHKETASLMGLSSGNVRVIQFRALQHLREFLSASDSRNR